MGWCEFYLAPGTPNGIYLMSHQNNIIRLCGIQGRARKAVYQISNAGAVLWFERVYSHPESGVQIPIWPSRTWTTSSENMY